MLRGIPKTEVKSEYVAFTGGLDTNSPPLDVSPGCIREGQNFEQNINGGYARISGYEVFDGKAKPSAAVYHILSCTFAGAVEVSVGDVLTDNATTSYGTVIALPTGQAVLTKLTGAFSAGNVKVGGVIVGTCSGAQTQNSAASPLLHATYTNLAADVYRALIGAVPGAGDVLGVWLFNDVVYAFRNAAGNATTDLYKSSAGGWTQVALGLELSFTSGGTYVVVEGNTITGATSSATAVITRVVLESGSWDAGTAAGRFIFASKTGTFQSENLNVGANMNVATIAGNSSAITIPPNGSYEFVNANFGGAINTIRVYGVNGVGRGFEFDGTVFAPISTGMATDTPEHVVVHKNHLFFSFAASVQHSVPGFPYQWSVVVGAGELGMGDDVTGFQIEAGGQNEAALAIFSRNSIAILYGSSSSDWLLNQLKEEAGATEKSIQHIGQTYVLDSRGITSLAAAVTYGNFTDASVSDHIHSWVFSRMGDSVVTGSAVNRERNQYRLFFSNKFALYVTVKKNKVVGMMPQLFADIVDCVCSGELSTGTEATFFGSENGYVFELDKGTSFDGDNIEAFIHMHYFSSKGPRRRHRYRRASFEVQGTGYATFSFSYDLGYASSEIDQSPSVGVTTSFSVGQWDSGTWDVLVWDGFTLAPSVVDMTGSAENVSIKVRSNADFYVPFKISGVILEHTPRRSMR